MMKSPLADKNSVVSDKVLKELLPTKSVIESFYLYSGTMEVSLALSDRLIVAHTNKYPTYEFWWMAKNRGHQVASMVENIFDEIPEKMLYTFQENWFKQRDPVYRAALFYILNRCSSMSEVSRGEIDKNRLNRFLVSRFKKINLDNFHILLDKFEGNRLNIANNIDSDYKFFPIGNYDLRLLESRDHGSAEIASVPHFDLHKSLSLASYKWVVLYKYHKNLIKKYDNYNIIMVDKYGNRTLQQDNCEDVIVTNF